MIGDERTVLQVLPKLDSGGVQRGTVDIAKHLVAKGWRVLVAAEDGEMARELTGLGATHINLPMASKNPITMMGNRRRLSQLIRDQGINLVHARSRAPAWSARLATKSTQTPFVTTFHGVYGGHEAAVKRRYNRVMADGDRVIAVSEFVADHVRDVYQVGPDRLRTIPRGIDLKTFEAEKVSGLRVSPMAERWGIDGSRKVIMLPGRITRIKGHLQLLRAAAKLNRNDFLVLFVGPGDTDGSYARQIELFLKTSTISPKVRFAGPCNDMPAAYKLADVVVVPSIGPEAFGRVSVEAQAMGKPVIVSGEGGLPETLMPASTGWLIDVEDIDGFAETLNLALDMPPEVKQRVAARAREFVESQYGLETMAERTVSVYRELLSR